MGLSTNLAGFHDFVFSSGAGSLALKLIPLILNLFVFIGAAWIVMTYAGKYIQLESLSRSRTDAFDSNNILILLVFSFSSLYLCLMGAESRFYPLPQACLLVMLLRAIDLKIARKRSLQTVILLMIIIYSFLFVNHAKAVFAFQPSKVDKILEGVTRESTNSRFTRVLLVNAPDIFSSPKYIAYYYGFNGDLDFLYNSKGSCGPYPDYKLIKNKADSPFAYTIKHTPEKQSLLPNGCDSTIAFNGYTMMPNPYRRDGADDVLIISGNEFRYLPAKEKSGKNLDYISVKKEYDEIFVANYETGGVKKLKAVN